MSLMGKLQQALTRRDKLGSPIKWMTRQMYSLASLGERLVAWADSQVGAAETGWNRGTDVEKYQEIAGLGTGGGKPWCACVMYVCALYAGFTKDQLPEKGKCAAVINWVKFAHKNGLIRLVPKRGRLFYWLDANGKGHTGVCIGPAILGIFRTIEGNTDGEDGSREGEGMHKRTRTLQQLRKHTQWGFIDLEGKP